MANLRKSNEEATRHISVTIPNGLVAKLDELYPEPGQRSAAIVKAVRQFLKTDREDLERELREHEDAILRIRELIAKIKDSDERIINMRSAPEYLAEIQKAKGMIIEKRNNPPADATFKMKRFRRKLAEGIKERFPTITVDEIIIDIKE
jgi:hypothetical protein